jgi:hypothetical protein
MVIARFELLDVDGGMVEPYAHAVTSLDGAVQSLITIMAAPMASDGSLRIYRDDLAAWRWIVEFKPSRPDTPDVLMAILRTLSQANGAQWGLPEITTQAWREFAILAILADAMVLEVDIPDAAVEVERMLLPQTFTARASLAGWQIVPIIETVDCVVVGGHILHGTTLEDMADYDMVAMEVIYNNDGADVVNPDHVTVSAEQHTLAIMQDGEIMLHKTFRTDFFITTERQTKHTVKPR